MNECAACKRSIRGESGISCVGVCGKTYHTAEKCCGITKSGLDALSDGNFLKFMCNDCVQYVHNVDYALKDIQSEVSKVSNHLNEYKDEFAKALMRNELELKQLLEAIENRFIDRINILKRTEVACASSLCEIKKFHELSDSLKSQNEKLFTDLKNNSNDNNKQIAEIKQLITNNNFKSVNNNLSFAEAVKKKQTASTKAVIPTASNDVPNINASEISSPSPRKTNSNVNSMEKVGKNKGAIPKSSTRVNGSIPSISKVDLTSARNRNVDNAAKKSIDNAANAKVNKSNKKVVVGSCLNNELDMVTA